MDRLNEQLPKADMFIRTRNYHPDLQHANNKISTSSPSNILIHPETNTNLRRTAMSLLSDRQRDDLCVFRSFSGLGETKRPQQICENPIYPFCTDPCSPATNPCSTTCTPTTTQKPSTPSRNPPASNTPLTPPLATPASWRRNGRA